MALLLSEEQMNRVLQDGMLQLFPSYTVDSKIRYTHICNGEKFARVHGNFGNAFEGINGVYQSNNEFVNIAPHITKIDSTLPVNFYPSFIYGPDVDLMMAGNMDKIMQHVMRAILRPVMTDSKMPKVDQFMNVNGRIVDDALALNVFESIVAGNSKYVMLACNQDKGCNDNIQSVLQARGMDWKELDTELTAKWS